MRTDHPTASDPRIAAALTELQALIQARYPSATFDVFYRDDPEGIRLRVTVDLEDPDEVLDVLLDKLYEVQVEQELPVYVIPVRTPERIAALLQDHRSQQAHSPSPVRGLG